MTLPRGLTHGRQALTRSAAPSAPDTYHFSDMVHNIDECIVYKQILHLQCMMPFVISINVIKHVLVNLISISVQFIFLPLFQAVPHPYSCSVLLLSRLMREDMDHTCSVVMMWNPLFFIC